MSGMDEKMEPGSEAEKASLTTPSRRQMLMMGAVATSAVISIRPALAQTAGSVMNCEIPVPELGRASNYISAEGDLVSPDTPGAFPPAGRAFKGEEVKAALQGRSLPDTRYEQSKAYMNYIDRKSTRLNTSNKCAYRMKTTD